MKWDWPAFWMGCAAVVASLGVVVSTKGHAASKAKGGCDIPKAWGRVAFFYPESASMIMVLEAQDGTLRFMAWNNCHVIAQANRVDLEESVSRK